MRVLLVNKFHWLKGGSERYYFDLARGLDNKVLQTQATSQMAMTHLAAGDRAEARTALEAGLDQVDDVRSLEALALYLDAVAWLAFAESNTVRAMTALGAANS